MAQWLELHASTAEGRGSIPVWETKIPQATQHGQKIKIKIRKYIYIYLINQYLFINIYI